ncbi:unnamed protein product, partial [Mesorhabditis spiculigera]
MDLKRSRFPEETILAFVDVISSLSLCSVDIDDIPAAMQNVSSSERKAHQHDQPSSERYFQHRSDSYAGSTASSGHEAQAGITQDPMMVESANGVSAGRANAIGTLARIICSKRSSESLPNAHLAQFYAMVYEALVEKDRLVLCSLFYYGHSLFRLGLPGVEALLPHWLFALDVILIESSKLRLHPSFPETDIRTHCLRSLATVISWPTVYGMTKMTQSPAGANLKSAAATYLHLRPRMYKTLIFSLRNETDAANLQQTLAMTSILVVESAAYDLGLSEEQAKDMMRISASLSQNQPEKGLCGSFVRGLISAVCDRLSRPEWAGDFSICLSAIDVLHTISSLHQSVLFSNRDMSAGSLIISSLCRFIETQLMKPPPLHSKDLHSSVVAAYSCIVAWLVAAPMLAECESVLNTVAEAVQLGVTGVRRHDEKTVERKAASKRVLDAAEYLLFSLFCVVGRKPSPIGDEARLAQEYGTSAIDLSKFAHFLVNGDTLLSIHEATHIPEVFKGSACVLYVRRTPMQAATIGIGRLLPTSEALAAGGLQEKSGNGPTKDGPSISSSGASTPTTPSSLVAPPVARQPAPQPPSLAEQFVIPEEFHKSCCKLDSSLAELKMTPEVEAIMSKLSDPKPTRHDERNIWAALTEEQRKATPVQPAATCDSLRIFLYDMGLVHKDIFGSELIYLDPAQSPSFYHDLHRVVDSCPARTLQTVHIFYVKVGQRSAVDILENALNIQNTSSEFCTLLAELGEGVEVGQHGGWTGHWSTAYASHQGPTQERSVIDHYILDGITHALSWTGPTAEIAFITPSERSVRIFKQDLPPPTSARRASLKSYSGHTSSEDALQPRLDPYYGARTKSNISTMSSDSEFPTPSSTSQSGAARRSGELRILTVWLERQEDIGHFPIDDLLPTCDDGAEKLTNGSSPLPTAKPSYIIIFLYSVEPGLVQVAFRGTPTRFGDPGPLIDGVVVSALCLPALLRLTVLNITNRSVAEAENHQMTHIKRRQAIADFGKRYASPMKYEDFLIKLMQRS